MCCFFTFVLSGRFVILIMFRIEAFEMNSMSVRKPNVSCNLSVRSGVCKQSSAYNIYATLSYTNPLFTGFSGYQNVIKEIIQTNIKRTSKPLEIKYFQGSDCRQSPDCVSLNQGFSYAYFNCVFNKYFNIFLNMLS